jgi:hypothetical protein
LRILGFLAEQALSCGAGVPPALRETASHAAFRPFRAGESDLHGVPGLRPGLSYFAPFGAAGGTVGTTCGTVGAACGVFTTKARKYENAKGQTGGPKALAIRPVRGCGRSCWAISDRPYGTKKWVTPGRERLGSGCALCGGTALRLSHPTVQRYPDRRVVEATCEAAGASRMGCTGATM